MHKDLDLLSVRWAVVWICEWKAVSWRLLFLDVVYKPIPALEQEHHGLVLNATPGLAL